MYSRYRSRFTYAKRVKLPDSTIGIRVVEFINNKEYRFFSPTKNTCNFFIFIGNTDGSIYDKNDSVGLFTGGLCLFTNAWRKCIIGSFWLQTARIYHYKIPT